MKNHKCKKQKRKIFLYHFNHQNVHAVCSTSSKIYVIKIIIYLAMFRYKFLGFETQTAEVPKLCLNVFSLFLLK